MFWGFQFLKTTCIQVLLGLGSRDQNLNRVPYNIYIDNDPSLTFPFYLIDFIVHNIYLNKIQILKEKISKCMGFPATYHFISFSLCIILILISGEDGGT